MKELSFEKMGEIEGGNSSEFATGLMCGAAVLLMFTGFFAPLATGPAIGCAIGLYANYGTMPRYNG